MSMSCCSRYKRRTRHVELMMRGVKEGEGQRYCTLSDRRDFTRTTTQTFTPPQHKRSRILYTPRIAYSSSNSSSARTGMSSSSSRSTPAATIRTKIKPKIKSKSTRGSAPASPHVSSLNLAQFLSSGAEPSVLMFAPLPCCSSSCASSWYLMRV